ncbi:hypothetical protein BOX15_Mlig006233g1 [Macrostomum lignano]|uniref:Schlafen AlbA-2 domain-containing protein n=1 Tax=Macrostomum lignano TaxID=282301 RepID=A0A267DKB2_9PLAT|nr:hypothetical protein BOX15_Mlig006233g1 [Macrostomum lignano]
MHVSTEKGSRRRIFNTDEDSPDAALQSLPASAVTMCVKENCYYYPLGCTLNCVENNRYEFKGHCSLTWAKITGDASVVKTPHNDDLPNTVLNPKYTGKKPISRSLCAMANSPDGGVVLCGVTDSGRVGGLPFSEPEKEHVMLALNKLFSDFRPPVGPERYRVHFVPVLAPGEVDEYISCHAPPDLDSSASPVVEASKSDQVDQSSLFGSLSNNNGANDGLSSSSPVKTWMDSPFSSEHPDSLLSKPLLTLAKNASSDSMLNYKSGSQSDLMNQPLMSDLDSELKTPLPTKENKDSELPPTKEADKNSEESSLSETQSGSNESRPHRLHDFMHCWCFLLRVDRYTDGVSTRRYVLRIEMLPQVFTTISVDRYLALNDNYSTVDDNNDGTDEADCSDAEDSIDFEEEDEFLSMEPLSIKIPVFVCNEEGLFQVRCLGANRCLSALQVQQLAEERALSALQDELVELRRDVRQLRQLRDQVFGDT